MFATQTILPSTAPAKAACEGVRLSAIHADVWLPAIALPVGYRPEQGQFRKHLNPLAIGSEDARWSKRCIRFLNKDPTEPALGDQLGGVFCCLNRRRENTRGERRSLAASQERDGHPVRHRVAERGAQRDRDPQGLRSLFDSWSEFNVVDVGERRRRIFATSATNNDICFSIAVLA
jgi:hypothetical protein